MGWTVLRQGECSHWSQLDYLSEARKWCQTQGNKSVLGTSAISKRLLQQQKDIIALPVWIHWLDIHPSNTPWLTKTFSSMGSKAGPQNSGHNEIFGTQRWQKPTLPKLSGVPRDMQACCTLPQSWACCRIWTVHARGGTVAWAPKHTTWFAISSSQVPPRQGNIDVLGVLNGPKSSSKFSRLWQVTGCHLMGQLCSRNGVYQTPPDPKLTLDWEQFVIPSYMVDLRLHHTAPPDDAYSMDLSMCPCSWPHHRDADFNS